MAQLPEYKTLVEKQDFFQEHDHYKIDTREQLDDWYQYYTHNIKREYPTDFIFRGSNASKVKLVDLATHTSGEEPITGWLYITY
ncbi:MAG: Uncharacterised protein [SAR116 cluster bacterium]|nr:MAG: Uncharacterised protein [SAR116 cluster bacterium]